MSEFDRMNGRRGAFLALFGLIYLAVGLSYCTAPADASVRQSMAWMPSWSPIEFCGALWCAAAVVAVVSAFQKIPGDRFGFMALAAVAAGWTVAYLISWVSGHADRGWVSAVLFAALAAAILVVSGMPNPIPRRPE